MTRPMDEKKAKRGRPRNCLFPNLEPPRKLERPSTLAYLTRGLPPQFRSGDNRSIKPHIIALEFDEGLDELSVQEAKKFLAPLAEARAQLRENQAKGSPSAARKRTANAKQKWFHIFETAAARGINLYDKTKAARKIRAQWLELGDLGNGSSPPTERTIRNNLDKFGY